MCGARSRLGTPGCRGCRSRPDHAGPKPNRSRRCSQLHRRRGSTRIGLSRSSSSGSCCRDGPSRGVSAAAAVARPVSGGLVPQACSSPPTDLARAAAHWAAVAWVSPMLGALAVVRWLWVAGLAVVAPQPSSDVELYYQDLLYQTALTGELRRSLVPGYPMGRRRPGARRVGGRVGLRPSRRPPDPAQGSDSSWWAAEGAAHTPRDHYLTWVAPPAPAPLALTRLRGDAGLVLRGSNMLSCRSEEMTVGA